jgi:4'-phosphopantetheinyl transferase
MSRVDEVEVFMVDMAAGRRLLSKYEALISSDERERARRFRFEEDRLRYVCMHAILRTLLSSRINEHPGAIVFKRNRHGKPSMSAACEFNISYSGNKGLIGLARLPIGVDIEKVDTEKVTPEMIEEVFGVTEREVFSRGCDDRNVSLFFQGWVRKESVIKATGLGISSPLPLVQSRLDCDCYTASYEGAEWFTCDLDCGPGYAAALTVACTRDLPKIHLRAIAE